MSYSNTIHLSESPNIFTLLSRAALPKKTPNTISLPELSVELKGVKTDAALLKEYSKVCGFNVRSHLPATFPHIMAFPLHMKILTDKQFPLPLLGLVHVQNSITQHRVLNIGEVFDIKCQLTNAQPSDSSVKFDVVTIATIGDKVVWEETSTFLHRIKQRGSKTKKARKALPQYDNTQVWALSSSLGRQYAKVSSDFNLIHLYAWSAKLFGFNRAIVHGMWSKTRCIAALSDTLGDQAFKADIAFKLPVFLPSTVSFEWQQSGESINLQLLDKKRTKPHLSGTITLL